MLINYCKKNGNLEVGVASKHTQGESLLLGKLACRLCLQSTFLVGERSDGSETLLGLNNGNRRYIYILRKTSLYWQRQYVMCAELCVDHF